MSTVLDPFSKNECFIHAGNAIELLYKIAGKTDIETANHRLDGFVKIGLIIREDMDSVIRQHCTMLKTVFPSLSLGDTMAIALAMKFKCVVLTSDKEFSRADKFVNVEQIR